MPSDGKAADGINDESQTTITTRRLYSALCSILMDTKRPKNGFVAGARLDRSTCCTCTGNMYGKVRGYHHRQTAAGRSNNEAADL